MEHLSSTFENVFHFNSKLHNVFHTFTSTVVNLMKLGFGNIQVPHLKIVPLCYTFHTFCDIVVHKYFESNNNATFNTYCEYIVSKFEIFPIS